MYKLYIRQKVFKLRDVYPVLDEDGNAVYQVEQDFRLIGNTVHVNHVSNQRSFVIDRELLRLMPRYQVRFNDGSRMTIRQRINLFRKQIEVSSKDYQLNLKGDFILDLYFDVYNGTTKVGYIEKAFLAWGDTFVITVLDPEFEEELLALLIVVDDILDMEARSHANS
ncbi:MAG: LURP-one-related family protein [Eubacteriales bacterium]|nr:LURP-one-related family protein [Eubacteriales bacterium]